jgi:mono/diheme cytochrome c family protein
MVVTRAKPRSMGERVCVSPSAAGAWLAVLVSAACGTGDRAAGALSLPDGSARVDTGNEGGSEIARRGGGDSGKANDASLARLECQQYFTDAVARRASLVRSLVNPSNGYSQLRLLHYDTGNAEDWSRLPEWNAQVDVVAADELDQPGGVSVGGHVSPAAHGVAISSAALACDLPALVALGEDAFFHYPVQASLVAQTATASRASFARFGFWVDDTYGAGGLVRQATPDGSSVLAYTCSTCHAASRAGALVVGVGNDALDLGALTVAATADPDPAAVANLLAWGPGRLDVTTEDGTEPVRFGDTRPVKWLGYLQADATVKVQDLVTVAIRLETLIVTSYGEQSRPPRAIALGLAAYIDSLGTNLPDRAPSTPAEVHGASIFASSCAGCHAPPALTGAPVALDVVGTNPTDGLSADRGTGTYRVPSLHGVSTRGPLLHDASLPDLDAMFDPVRTLATYTGGRLGPGPVPGHTFGLELDGADRADLLAYLQTL